MNRKPEIDSQLEDPYEVIRRLRAVVEEQKDQLEEYQFACDSLIFEKNAAVKQASDLKREVTFLTQKLEYEQMGKPQTNTPPLNLFHTRVFSKQNRLNYASLSPQLAKSDLVSSHIIRLNSPLGSTAKKQTKSKEFVPAEIVFKNKQHFKSLNKTILSGQSSSEYVLEKVGENLIEDFVIISPDVLELKRRKEGQKEEKQLTISEEYFFNFNPLYKNRKSEYLRDIAKRAFPLGAQVRRKSIDSLDQFKTDMQFDVSSNMGEEFFIINLKGDLADSQKSKILLGNCNPFQALFAVCLKVPDFIPIRQQKPYQKKDQQVWMVQKVYAVLTYFPFFHIHLSILSKIHSALQPSWYKLQKQELLSKNLQRNLTEAQQNQYLNKLVANLMNKKPEFNQLCLYQNDYFGSFPSEGFSSEYAIARFACGIFFSVFAYEQMLLLLTALFMEKTIIFASKSQSAGTLCALFLICIITPFKYNQHLILNCDKQKIQSIVFEFPFILVASIKKDKDFSNVLKRFIDSNCDRFKGFNGKDTTAPLILVDIDSNSIFYDPLLNKTFEEMIISPSDKLRDAYAEVNPSNSKSFTFPKKMPKQFSSKPKNNYQKNQEERRKLQKQYQQSIDNNTSKWPTYIPTEAHLKVLELLTEYIRSFEINPSYEYQLIVNHGGSHELRKEAARRHLLENHPSRHKFVNALIQSQLYADYLDEMQKRIEIVG